MPKNCDLDKWRRWQALDAELSGPGLDFRAFAKQWGVDERTIFRDGVVR
jgi:hypothetical protein